MTTQSLTQCVFTTLLICIILLVFPPHASGEPYRIFSVDAESLALASALTASPETTNAAFYNPGAVIQTKRLDAAFSIHVSKDYLKINDKPSDLSTYISYNLGLSVSLPFQGFLERRVFIAASINLPNDSLYQLEQPVENTPNILFWGSHSRRLSLYTTLGIRLHDAIGLGVGFSVLPNVFGNVSIDFQEKHTENATNISVGYNFAPIIGLYWNPISNLALGATYRGAHRTQMNIPVKVYLSELIPEILAEVHGVAFGTPHEISFGISYMFSTIPLKFLFDLTWQGYSQSIASSPTVSVQDASGQTLQTAVPENYDLNNAFNIRLGAQYLLLNALKISLGYAFVESPVPSQHYYTNLLDADHHEFALGMSYVHPFSQNFRLTLATAAQLQHYHERYYEKWVFDLGNPGFPNLAFSGNTLLWKFTIKAEF